MSKQDETNNALMVIDAKLPKLNDSALPRMVYHYTDTTGLLGILSSGVLWASDYRYLNDSSEITYVYRLAVDVIGQDYLGRHSDLAGAFVDYAATIWPSYNDTKYYLCCFSEQDNSLSQWRAYAGRQGFCLEFPGDITPHHWITAENRQNPGITLVRVNYDIEEQKTYIRTLLDALTKLCGTPLMKSYESADKAIASISPFYWAALERMSYRFKHPDFDSEHEWRLVTWGDQYVESFRTGRTITPYINLGIHSQSRAGGTQGKLPITSVRHGPGTLAAETMIAMDRLLSTSGYNRDSCERRGSNTPVRL